MERGDKGLMKKPLGDSTGVPPGSRYNAHLNEWPNKSNPRNQGPDGTPGRQGGVDRTLSMATRKTGKV